MEVQDTYASSSTFLDFYHQIVHGGRYVPWRVPTSMWLNVIQKYYLKPQNGWDVSINGHFEHNIDGERQRTTMVATSMVDAETSQPRLVIAALEHSYYMETDEDAPTENLLQDTEEFMLSQRLKWIGEKAGGDPTVWERTYVISVVGTSVHFYVLKPDENQLLEYFPERHGMWYDAIEDWAIINEALIGIQEDVEH
ncbi:hypothetical protein TSTA_011690 [Talaromyces stipitatus ATCC 10500]|uniref:Uncharacterized protein n=1 Tax=Talaromyces stipitatus (strain ATCC 10500 / CBS 375.48 / QM 6759 / NRRL 1006) TaxID=441959 RepID=B8MDY3_TALSN|nr:uncharacterized protein TSTA_011690 [Talaromyces stipitatus ATCC 10500]EED16060.1 hypothetical protein TSTA_011690 [Talaromyces stipitatus ATCC 10500]